MDALTLAYDCTQRLGALLSGIRPADDTPRHTRPPTHHQVHRAGNRKFPGGLVVCVIATAVATALIGVVLAGRAAVESVSTAAGSGLNGASTCRDFLASPDPTAKAAVMKDLYLARHKPDLAADPFLVANTRDYCGNHPAVRLADVAARP